MNRVCDDDVVFFVVATASWYSSLCIQPLGNHAIVYLPSFGLDKSYYHWDLYRKRRLVVPFSTSFLLSEGDNSQPIVVVHADAR